jgi:transcriptional regulator with GAF, ATPase, and Fis domain
MVLTRGQAEKLRQYDWPGNVRELKNVIERAVILSPGNVLRLDVSMPDVDLHLDEPSVSAQAGDIFLSEKEMRDFQKKNLVTALKQTNWRVSGPDGAAALLGVKSTTLADRIRTYGIRKPVRR